MVKHSDRVHKAPSHKNPLAAPLDKLVQHERNVVEDEAADVEAKELGRMPRAQLEANVRGRTVLETRVFDLASDLVCSFTG